MRKNVLLLSALFSCFTLSAQQISEADAKLKAQQFLHRTEAQGEPAEGMHKAPANVNNVLELAHVQQQDGNVLYYVFNELDDDKGFVIVGGDECCTEILGYSNHAAFVYDSLPPSMQWWLSQYNQQISHSIRQRANMEVSAEDGNAASAAFTNRVAAQTQTVVPPLVSTKWDQDYPFNANLPWIFPNNTEESNSSRNRLATGCVATAMAQVMKYNNYPVTGTGSHSINRTVNGVGFSANFGVTTYDWANMQNTYTGSEAKNSAAVQSVATLMYHCGVSIDATYNTLANGGTSAVTANIPAALVDYFGYDRSVQYIERNHYTDAQWEQIILNELENNRPVVYGGQSSSSGHCFVCDGYNGSLFHINWGWGGYCDTYFALTGASALQPNGSGSGGAGANAAYTGSQEAVINIKPNEGGSYVYNMAWVDVQLNETQYIPHRFNQDSIQVGGQVTLQGGFKNASITDLSAAIAVKFTNRTNPEQVYYKQFTTISNLGASYYSYSEYVRSVTTSSIPAGRYDLTLSFKREGTNEWVDFISGEPAHILVIFDPNGSEENPGEEQEPDDGHTYAMEWIDAYTSTTSYIPHRINESEVNLGERISIQGGFCNRSDVTISAAISAKFTSVANSSQTYLVEFHSISNLQPNYYSYSQYLKYINTTNIPAGVYDITLAFKRNGSNLWQDFILNESPHRLTIIDPNAPETPTGLDDLSGVRVLPMQQGIQIMGAEGQSAAIYSVTGQLIYSIERLSQDEIISLPGMGMFIVRIGNYTQNIIL